MPDFSDLAARLETDPLSLASSSPATFRFPDPFDLFVPPEIALVEAPGGADPLASDVLLFSAPAAVGKSTFARALAAKASIPLIDLAETRVSTHALGGALQAELGAAAHTSFLEGSLPIIVDALDEGIIFSGEEDIERFLETSYGLLASGARVVGRPRLILMGRAEAVNLARLYLEIDHGSSLSLSEFRLDYFGADGAMELVKLHALAKGASPEHSNAIEGTTASFFDAIARAVDVPPERMWDDPRSRAFAGYAPVLEAVGGLIADEDNYVQLQNRLSNEGAGDAWGVLEVVANVILERESGKVRRPLAARHGDDIPAEAFGPAEQLELLSTRLARRQPEIGKGLVFGSNRARSDYVTAVTTHLPEHPFIRDGLPANPVIGSLILAHAIAEGKEIESGVPTELISAYARQPFLWRFLSRRVVNAAHILGETVGYVVSSLWSDPADADTRVVGRTDAGTSIWSFAPGLDDGNSCQFHSIGPVILRSELRQLDVQLEGDELVLAGWPGSQFNAIDFLADARIEVNSLRFDLRLLRVGQDGSDDISLFLKASESAADELLQVEVAGGSSLVVDGALKERYPWTECALPYVPPRTDDEVTLFLDACRRRLKAEVSIVVYEDGLVPDWQDQRVSWAKNGFDEQMLPTVLKAMVANDLASTRNVASNGPHAMVRVSPNLPWEDLYPLLRNELDSSEETESRVRAMADEVRRVLRL